VADRLHLGGLRQQLVQVSLSAGQVHRVAVLVGVGIVEDVTVRCALMGSMHVLSLSPVLGGSLLSPGGIASHISRRLPSMAKRKIHSLAPVWALPGLRPPPFSYLLWPTVATLARWAHEQAHFRIEDSVIPQLFLDYSGWLTSSAIASVIDSILANDCSFPLLAHASSFISRIPRLWV